MKAILCLLVVVCAVNADMYDKMMAVEDKLRPQLEAIGISYDHVHAALKDGKESSSGKSEKEEKKDVHNFLKNGCEYGFVGSLPKYPDIEQELESKLAQEVICADLHRFEAGAEAIINHPERLEQMEEEMGMGSGMPVV